MYLMTTQKIQKGQEILVGKQRIIFEKKLFPFLDYGDGYWECFRAVVARNENFQKQWAMKVKAMDYRNRMLKAKTSR